MRDYEPGDPMHHVHWRLSAHAGKLQTKRYEPTRSAEVLFALDVANGEPFWHAVDPDTAEESIGWTSYLARQAIRGLAHGPGRKHAPASRPRAPARADLGLGRQRGGAVRRPRPHAEPTDQRPGARAARGRPAVGPPDHSSWSRRGRTGLSHEMEVLRRRGCDVILSPLEAFRRAAS